MTDMLSAYQKRSENDVIDPQVYLAEIDRLVRSPHLSGSEALCKLLQFLAQHTLNSPEDHLKEYEIATQVFGRPSDFDPQADSGVRVQVGRLRTKLAEYYQSAGANDPIQVEVPKGSYSLSFRQRVVPAALDSPEASEPSTAAKPTRTRPPLSLLLSVTALISVLTTAGVLFAVFHRAPSYSDPVGNQTAQTAAPSLRTFWGPFLHGPEVPFVVFSNAQFVGNPISGMRYYDPSKDSRGEVSQHYTGIGEVMGVEELEGLFLHFGQQVQIKRSGLFTLDDARKSDLIFVGSPTENLTLGEIPQNSGFAFKQLQVGQDDWAQGIVDLRARPGENATYLPSPETQPMQVDYAVITLTHGLDRSRWTLILAGASTIGTQAAVDFACDPDSVKDLLHRLDLPTGTGMKPFEALLRVKVSNDVPLAAELVKIRITE
ncbi:MAG: helix-turn-helix domain-containing protein [Terracidiphilus sp.]